MCEDLYGDAWIGFGVLSEPKLVVITLLINNMVGLCLGRLIYK